MNETTVTRINDYAREVQAKGFGTAAARAAYNELAALLYTTAKSKVDYFFQTYCSSYRIDKAQLLSLALFEGVKYTIDKWDADKCDYFKRYTYYLPRLFKTHLRDEVHAEVRMGMTSAIGIDTPVGDDIIIADTLVDDSPTDDILNLYRKTAAMLRDFGKQYGEDKAAIMAILLLNSDSLEARTKAVTEYYGADTYNNTIRKRVERIRKSFQDFYIENAENYD